MVTKQLRLVLKVYQKEKLKNRERPIDIRPGKDEFGGEEEFGADDEEEFGADEDIVTGKQIGRAHV